MVLQGQRAQLPLWKVGPVQEDSAICPETPQPGLKAGTLKGWLFCVCRSLLKVRNGSFYDYLMIIKMIVASHPLKVPGALT